MLQKFGFIRWSPRPVENLRKSHPIWDKLKKISKIGHDKVEFQIQAILYSETMN